MKMKGRKNFLLLLTATSLMLAACGKTEPQDTESQEVSVTIEDKGDNLALSDDIPENVTIDFEDEKTSDQDEEIAVEVISENAISDNQVIEEDSSEAEEVKEPEINDADITTYENAVTYYAHEKLKIRKGPGTEFDVIGMLNVNDEISVIGESKSSPWKEIKYGEERAFVHGNYINTEKIDLEAITAQQADAQAAEQVADAAAEEAAKQAAEEAAKQAAEEAARQAAEEAARKAAEEAAKQVKNPSKTLFIGDSRTCQMQNASNGGGCDWICEYGSKFEWFRDTAVVAADKMVGKGTRVVICMGVNDPDNLSSYASVVNQKAAEWTARGAKVYYVSINPVEPPYDFKDADIANFNASMPGMISGVKWIDTFTAVKNGNFVLEDGIHYDAVGNAAIFKMIYRSL